MARLRQALGDAQQRAQAAERQAAEARDASVQLKRRLAEISQVSASGLGGRLPSQIGRKPAFQPLCQHDPDRTKAS